MGRVSRRDRESRVKRPLLNNSCIFSDARRVAPISACVFNRKILAGRIAPISVSISTRHLQYFFYRLDIYFDRLGLICNHLCPCAFYAG